MQLENPSRSTQIEIWKSWTAIESIFSPRKYLMNNSIITTNQLEMNNWLEQEPQGKYLVDEQMWTTYIWFELVTDAVNFKLRFC